MARLISDIVEQEILQKIDRSLKIEQLVPAAFGAPQKVKFCTDKWYKLFERVTVVRSDYELGEPDKSGFYEVPAGLTLTYTTEVLLPLPVFFCGTLSNTKLEWSKFSTKERDKLPFVWLTKPTAETWPGGNPGVRRSAQLELWFVHWSDWTKLNAYREQEAVRPLFALFEAFTDAITANPIFDGFDVANTKDFPKFATESPNGVENTIFESTLSAVNANLTINIFQSCCKNC